MARGPLERYVEWMSRGRLTGRVAYVTSKWDMPLPRPGAEWQLDPNFNAAEELLRRPELKDIIKAAIDTGATVVDERKRRGPAAE